MDDAEAIEVLLRDADPERQRSLATAAARAATSRRTIGDPRMAAGLAALAAGRLGDGTERAAVERLVSELDERAWDHRDDGDEASYAKEFVRARAANNAMAALDADPAVAAADAVHEAECALEDLPALRAALEQV